MAIIKTLNHSGAAIICQLLINISKDINFISWMDFTSLPVFINPQLRQSLFKPLGDNSNVGGGVSDGYELGLFSLVSPAAPIASPSSFRGYFSTLLFFCSYLLPHNRPRHVSHSSGPAIISKPDSTGLADPFPKLQTVSALTITHTNPMGRYTHIRRLMIGIRSMYIN